MADHNFIQDLLFLGFLSFIGVLILNLLGKLITPIFSLTKNDKPYFNFFIESLVGFVGLTTIYSIFLFGIYTIHIIALLFFLVLVIDKVFLKKEKVNYRFKKYDIKALIFIPIIPFITVIISVLLPPAKGIVSDVSFYCKVAESFSVINKENFFHFFNFHGPEFNGTVPYHYIEMYLGSLFFKLFSWTGYSDMIIFKYLVYNSLKSIVFVGVLAFAEKFKKPGLLEFMLMILLICIDFVFITDFDYSAYPLYTGMWMRPNFIIYHLFLIAVFYFLFEKNLALAGAFIVLFIIATAVVAPPLLVATGLLLLWLILRKKETRKEAKKLLVGAIVLAIFIALFYKLTGTSSNTMGAYSLSVKEMIAKSFGLWKAIVGYTVTLSMRVLLLTYIAISPILLLGKKEFLGYFKTNSLFIAFIVLLPVCGIIIFQSLAYLDNMYQFPYVGYVGCYLLFIFNVFYCLNKKRSPFQNVVWISFISLIIFLGLYAKMPDLKKDISLENSIVKTELASFGLNNSTIRQLTKTFSKHGALKGGTILDERDIKEEYMGYRQSLTAQVGFYLMYLQDNANIESLSDPKELYPDTNLTAKEYLKAIGFNRLTSFYRNYNSDSSYNYNLKKYISENKMQYLVLSKQVDVSKLKNINYSMHIKDTGYQFLILK